MSRVRASLSYIRPMVSTGKGQPRFFIPFPCLVLQKSCCMICWVKSCSNEVRVLPLMAMEPWISPISLILKSDLRPYSSVVAFLYQTVFVGSDRGTNPSLSYRGTRWEAFPVWIALKLAFMQIVWGKWSIAKLNAEKEKSFNYLIVNAVYYSSA